MQSTVLENKKTEIILTLLLAVGVLTTGLHAQDVTRQIVRTKALSAARDDSSGSSLMQKFANDLHNHIHKFKLAHLKIEPRHIFDSGSQRQKARKTN